MHIHHSHLLIVLGVVLLAAPAFADDCAAVKSAMLNSGHTPHTVIVTATDAQGKKTITRQVQTVDNKYVQTADGKWHAMNIAIKDLNDNMSSVKTCRRTGSDNVAGESASVYAVHTDTDGEAGDQKLWVSSNNRIVRAEVMMRGARYTTEYDFAHVTPPANAIPMGR
jgi:hypothetical protein